MQSLRPLAKIIGERPFCLMAYPHERNVPMSYRHGIWLSLVGLALAVGAATPSASAQDAGKDGKLWVFVGTYTGGKAGSKGIYRCELDLTTGKLSPAALAAEVTSPSFLAIHPGRRFLYAVNEVS